MKKRIVSTMPFISLLLFLVALLVFNQGWMSVTFFLLIPLSTILLSNNMLKRVHQLMPLIALLLFLWVFFGFNQGWAWVFFLLIPLSDIFLNGRIRARKLVTLFVLAVFIGIGIYTSKWHPAWIILFTIPVINGLFFPNDNRFIYINKSSIKEKFHAFIDDEDEDAFFKD